MLTKQTTPFDSPLDSPLDTTPGDVEDIQEIDYDRELVISELLALEFDEDTPYTRAELDVLSDDDLIDLYNNEMFGDEVDDDTDPGDEVQCCICGETKPCPFEDEDGEAICAECEESADSPGDDDDDDDEELEDESEED